MSTSGRNWGAVVVNGTSLMFSVEGQPAFEVPIPEVSQAQSGKEELMLEFHVDDTTVQVGKYRREWGVCSATCCYAVLGVYFTTSRDCNNVVQVLLCISGVL